MDGEREEGRRETAGEALPSRPCRGVRALVNEPSRTVFSRNLTSAMRGLLWGEIVAEKPRTSQRMHGVSDMKARLRKR